MKTLFFLVFVLQVMVCTAEQVIWKGDVVATGERTDTIPLTLGKKYKIVVSGTINLGKWQQQGKPLANDACYEYHDELRPTYTPAFQSSNRISVCDGHYHADHRYVSKWFVATQEGIYFWIKDEYYPDNTGALQVEFYKE